MSFAIMRHSCFLVLLSQLAYAQIKVMTPEWLVRQFPDGRGKIEGSTATFGAPFYGDRVLGRLVYGPSLKNHSHCREDDYDIPQIEPALRGQSGENAGVKLINIFIVRRGKCSFTTKVRVAYEKGAHAVIIVDREDSKLTVAELANIIVADDGFGDKIHIPSVLVTKVDGNRLMEAVQRSQVVVELAWDVPTNHVVQIDVWMSSASVASQKFLQEFAPKRRALNQVMLFVPHYAVFSMDKDSKDQTAVYNDLCSDETGRFCAEDPDGAGPITGKEVLREDVRQLCIHEIYKVVGRTTMDAPQSGTTLVEYAAKYWDYVEKFKDTCPLEAANPQDRFGLDCSERLMKAVGIEALKVAECADRTQEEKLKHEKENRAWSPRAVRINGWRYSGMLDADLVTRAMCSGFINQPKECKDLVAPRDHFASYFEQPQPAQPSFGISSVFGYFLGTIQGAVVGSCIIAVGLGVMMLYNRSVKRDTRTALREEVMLEVQAAMGEYSRMQGNG